MASPSRTRGRRASVPVGLALSASLGALGISAMSVAALDAASQRERRERQMYVTVVDRAGKPVPGLGPSDFVVREDGAAREVLRVEPATEPMQLALVVDNSQASTASTRELREAVTAFYAALGGRHEVALITIGERPVIAVDYTRNAELQRKGLSALFPRPGSGAYFLEALTETTRGFRKREATRPVIVAVLFEAAEFSTTHYDAVLDALKETGAALHVLMLQSTSAGLGNDEVRNRNVVIDRGTRDSGGGRHTILTSMSFKDRLTEIAAELLQQYRVTYGRPESLLPPTRIVIETTKPGLTARGTLVRPSKGA